MRLVLQRVSRAAVRVDGRVIGEIGRGMVALVGIERGDGEREVEAAAKKISELRIFDDGGGRMNLAATQAGASFLVISQFTLLAATDRGRRPSFERAAPPGEAAPLVERLIETLRAGGLTVASGRFGAHMEVELANDGPVTLVLDFPPRPQSGE
jgi:D-tyrosyl-tRNA(Tyr) deacylase